MGSVCSCFSVTEEGSAARSGNRCWPFCLIHNLVNKCGALFGGGGRTLVHSSDSVEILSSSDVATLSNLAVTTPSNMRGTTPLNLTGTTPSSLILAPSDSSEFNRTPGRAVTNTNCARSDIQQDVIVIRHDKESSHSCPVLESGNDADFQVKDGDSHVKEGPEVCCSNSSAKVQPLDEETALAYALSSFEDEDVCPTCLEEYTPENPKIIASCSHHYHLGCIYEWMERSKTCPVCGKLMIFDETR